MKLIESRDNVESSCRHESPSGLDESPPEDRVPEVKPPERLEPTPT
jgi:hypothetical protein